MKPSYLLMDRELTRLCENETRIWFEAINKFTEIAEAWLHCWWNVMFYGHVLSTIQLQSIKFLKCKYLYICICVSGWDTKYCFLPHLAIFCSRCHVQKISYFIHMFWSSKWHSIQAQVYMQEKHKFTYVQKRNSLASKSILFTYIIQYIDTVYQLTSNSFCPMHNKS